MPGPRTNPRRGHRTEGPGSGSASTSCGLTLQVPPTHVSNGEGSVGQHDAAPAPPPRYAADRTGPERACEPPHPTDRYRPGAFGDQSGTLLLRGSVAEGGSTVAITRRQGSLRGSEPARSPSMRDPSRAAALLNCWSSATATKYRICLSFTSATVARPARRVSYSASSVSSKLESHEVEASPGSPGRFNKVGGYPVRIKITNPDHSALVGIGSNSGGLESA